MKRIGFILLFLASFGIQFFAPKSAPAVQPDTTADCTVQQHMQGALVGIQGEPLTLTTSGQVHFSAPTHFSHTAERVQFGRNRTRTAFLRRMIHHYQRSFCPSPLERGWGEVCSSRIETSYYVYSLRRILC